VVYRTLVRRSTDEFKLPTIVVGTKADLEHARAVTGSELKKWADEHGVSYYTEVHRLDLSKPSL
jgi:hypothetical protein